MNLLLSPEHVLRQYIQKYSSFQCGVCYLPSHQRPKRSLKSLLVARLPFTSYGQFSGMVPIQAEKLWDSSLGIALWEQTQNYAHSCTITQIIYETDYLCSKKVVLDTLMSSKQITNWHWTHMDTLSTNPQCQKLLDWPWLGNMSKKVHQENIFLHLCANLWLKIQNTNGCRFLFN